MTSVEQEIESAYGIPLPKELAQASRTRVVHYEPEQPGLGISASYVTGYFQIALYVYDLNLKDIPEDPMSEVVVAHMQQSIGEAISVAQGRGEKLECRAAYGVPYAGISVDYLVAALGRENEEGRLSSLIFLTTKSGRFIKLRISFIEASFTAENLAKTIASSYFALLWPELAPKAHRFS
jgi:hypothetical protein